MTIPIVGVKKLGLREVERLLRDHTAGRRLSWHLNLKEKLWSLYFYPLPPHSSDTGTSEFPVASRISTSSSPPLLSSCSPTRTLQIGRGTSCLLAPPAG